MEPTEPAERTQPNILYRVAIGALIFIIALLVGLSAAHATEIVPSIGLTRAADGSGETKTFYDLALRGSMVPLLKHEIAVGYRSEEYFGGDLKVTMVPVTASLWLAPVPLVYAGAGVGLYASAYNYRDIIIPDTSKQNFGAHLGAGLNFPLAPMVAVDLNSRYVFMGEQATALQQGKLNPNYWSTSAGIAIKF